MAKKTLNNKITQEIIELYDKLIKADPIIERKGLTMPYTSLNGHMFSFIDKNGDLSLRLPETEKNNFIKKYKTRLSVQHGIVMKEYVMVPAALLEKTAVLKKYFEISVEYIRTLKPKKK